MGQVAIIILQYGNADATIDCISSVIKYNTYKVKFIVVDNGSPEESDRVQLSDAVRRLFGSVIEVDDQYIPDAPLPQVTIVKSAVNDGYARGNNKGLRLAYADGDIDQVLILNNDTLFVEDIIPKLVADINTLHDAALVTPLLYKKDLQGVDVNCARNYNSMRDSAIVNMLLTYCPASVYRRCYIPVSPSTGIHKVSIVSGSCMMCRKDLFESVGGFDPGTFLYWEENILAEKFKRIGKRNYVDTDIKCIHLGASTTRRVKSYKILRHSIDSQLYFARNYWPARTSFKLAALKLSASWLLLVFAVHDRLFKRKK
ncbi:MAG: glycosyltransferase family 2 protein [Muribaculaceae bacterium]|nr:glycosyltransferase family 2 protein [Muribaculaceae bacterium]